MDCLCEICCVSEFLREQDSWFVTNYSRGKKSCGLTSDGTGQCPDPGDWEDLVRKTFSSDGQFLVMIQANDNKSTEEGAKHSSDFS